MEKNWLKSYPEGVPNDMPKYVEFRDHLIKIGLMVV